MATPTLVNITISVPNGTVTHDDGHVLCVYGSSWRATLYITTFFLVNYAAHAATIKSNPGDRTSVTVCNMVLALFFPVSGLMRALNGIVRFGRRGGSDLEKTCRAGALCMVVRVNGWLPANGQTLNVPVDNKSWSRSLHDQHNTDERWNNSGGRRHRPVEAEVKVYRPSYSVEESSTWLFSDISGGRAYVDTAATKVHGTYSLSQGYGFAILPRNTRLVEWAKNIADGSSSVAMTDGNEIAYTYSMAKAAVSIIQSFAALAVLLGHRKDVVHRWGYASFHLTIIPYLVMTIFNFVSNICTADYDGLYMVETHVMDEARTRGGLFEGTVAATYTATTFASEPLQQLSGAELRSHHRSEQTYLRGVAQRLAKGRYFKHVDILNHLFATRWSNMSATCTPERVTAVACVNRTIDAHAYTIGDHQPQMEDAEAENNLQPHTSQDTASHAPILPRSSPPETATAVAIQLLTDTGICYLVRVPTIPPSLVAALRKDISTRVAASLWYQIVVGTAKSIAKNRRTKGVLSLLRSACGVVLQISTEWTRFIWSVLRHPERILPDFLKNHNAPSGMYQRTGPSPATIYVPACHRFLCSDDIPDSIDEQEILLPPQRREERQEYSRSGRFSVNLPIRKSHHNTGGILAQIGSGTTVIGLIIVLVGWQSHWFSAGEASLTQRVIILLWMSEGVFGMLLTFLSLSEIVLIFFVFPAYLLLYPEAFPITQIDPFGVAFYIACLLISIFIAPIWGFVIVGKMVVEWGQCVTLYH